MCNIIKEGVDTLKKKLLKAIMLFLLTSLAVEPSGGKIVSASEDTSLPPVHYSTNDLHSDRY